MGSVSTFLITVAGIFLLGAAGEAIFKRTNIPDVVWLILAGVIIGPLSGLVGRHQLIAIAPYFAALTLVVVLFEGGSRLELGSLTAAAPRSALLALLTYVLAVGTVAGVVRALCVTGVLPSHWGWLHALLVGSILGGSSSLIIMPAMVQSSVEPRVANLVNLESAFTDAFCVVGASALINLILGGDSGGSAWEALGRSFGIGFAVGVGAAVAWLLLLRPIRGSEHAYPITLAALFLLYVMIERLGGSAALGILAFSVLVGNARSIGKIFGGKQAALGRDVRGVHSQISFIVKSFFFTFIGAMLTPPWSLIAVGFGLGLLLLVARVPGVWLSMLGGGFSRKEQLLVVVAMPRGMAAGVLATLPATMGVKGTEQLPSLVFACVVTTIFTFASGFPLVRAAQRPPPASTSLAPSPAPAGTDAASPQPAPAPAEP